jgi:glycosyltransferase involved in cell wall biosynthesis
LDHPLVAVISNALAPYRLHLHRRIVREVPEIRLASLFTHGTSTSPWAYDPPAEINPVQFGPGESVAQQDQARYALHEWRKGGRVIRWLREHRARAVVLCGYNDPGRLRVLFWCRRRGLPVFLWADSNIRGDRAGGVKKRLKRLILPRVLRLCSGVLPCGSLGQAYFARYGVPRERMFLVPVEPDYDLVRSVTAEQVAAVQARYGLDPSRRRVIYSGRLDPGKRLDLVIDAFAAVAPDRPDWDLALVGGGPIEKELRDRVPPGLSGRVHWLGFFDDQATISALYRAADVLVLASDKDAWASVINEGLAAGLAAVASDVVGAAAELVRDGVNGRVFPAGDLAALTACLRDVTAPEKYTAYKAAAAAVLAEWRRRADPVDGLRAALTSVGVLGGWRPGG